MRRVILLHSRRLRRSQRAQALQHAMVGLTLVLTGIEGWQSPEGSLPLVGFEILAGALLFLTAAREVRGKSHGPSASVSVVDILAGVAATAEGLHLSHRGSHRIQFAYYALAAVMLLKGTMHGRLLRRCCLELAPHGFLIRARSVLFRAVRHPWHELSEVRETPDALQLHFQQGPPYRFNLADLENGEEVRAAFLGYRETRVALVREVSPRLAACELTHVSRQPIDYERARTQHEAFVDLLASLGCAIRPVRPTPDLPDSVFVEDTAIVLDELAIVTRPGAASRRPETATIEPVLREYRPLCTIEAPGTLDGGDVLVVGKQIFVGLSSRTNPEAVEQLRLWVEPIGYQVRPITPRGCLHLKSAATVVGDRLLLVNPAWVDTAAFAGLGIVEVDPAEPQAANALLVGEAVIVPAAYPATRQRLQAAGVTVHELDLSELAKAEGAATCCCLIFRMVPAATPGPSPA